MLLAKRRRKAQRPPDWLDASLGRKTGNPKAAAPTDVPDLMYDEERQDKLDGPLGPPPIAVRAPRAMSTEGAAALEGGAVAGVKAVRAAGDPVAGLGKARNPSAIVQAQEALSVVRLFTFRKIKKATNGFSDSALIGQGAFGRVFRATFSDGTVLAVKELGKGKKGVGQKEFVSELGTIGNVRHRNLVSLRGYCIAANAYYLLMDYAPNGNLQTAISNVSGAPLTWKQRLDIATGAVRGISYLHNDTAPTILHRDIKSANILLGANFEPLVADFGLAKLVDEGVTHHSTAVRGTYGYVAPEYALYGQVTKMIDVYSFGVVLLELVTGRRAVEAMPDGTRCNLVDAVARHARQPNDVVDPRLHGHFPAQVSAQFVALAVGCTAREDVHRPQMSHVLRELEDMGRRVEADSGIVTDGSWFGSAGTGQAVTAYPSASTSSWNQPGASSGSAASDGIMASMDYQVSAIRQGR
ncbi:Protein kinase superfamily protein [Klebsormidium nitens]|uniref:non-specific serine/threonine protein kinase n=1 Tax=Klebsormidium nitens TaxID=105231 RepID=A0A1Y1HIQ9_KLENI|nr:Protein kinase superfamily protein [Klebsormidium nitens]|eukprot:GAQ78385.1 Protein kinase superfamily protein [Klebsormidium nitens]